MIDDPEINSLLIKAVGEMVSTAARPGEFCGTRSIFERNFSMKAFVAKVSAFAREEDGVALTEYLILLALLVGGVIGTVTAAGGNLSDAWGSWGSWWMNSVSTDAIVTQ
ncbi:Flp pilus assembly pilin Flp [Sinorhizobium fredii]